MISVPWLDGGSAGYWVGQREKALACVLSIRHRSRNRSRPGQEEARVDLLGTGSSTRQATRRGNSGSATQPRFRSALKLITYPSADGCAWVLGCAQFLAAARLVQPHLRNWICSSWLLSAHVPMKTAQQKASSSTRPPRRAQLASEPSPVEKEGGARSEFLSLACPTVGQQARFASNAKLRPEPAQPFLTLGCSRGCEPPPRDEASQTPSMDLDSQILHTIQVRAPACPDFKKGRQAISETLKYVCPAAWHTTPDCLRLLL